MSDAPDAVGHKRPEAGTPQWVEDQVQQYLRSGDHDMMFPGWPGMHFLDAARQGTHTLQAALVEEVLRRAEGVLKLPALSEDARHIVGLSQETTCYVAMSYFDEDGPFADFVVHEAAHVFHNCKRETLGLAVTRRHEWLLEIDYAKRETFAYACEAYSRISSTGGNHRQRQQALEEHAQGPLPPDDRVEHDEYLDILGEAVRARNGWQRILSRCAPSRVRRPSAPMTP